MNNLNSILIEGVVADDPEFRTIDNACLFTLASTRSVKKEDGGTEEEVTFVDVETQGKLAEAAKNNAVKGRGLRVVGRLALHRGAGKCGYNCDMYRIVADHLEFRPDTSAKKQGGFNEDRELEKGKQ